MSVWKDSLSTPMNYQWPKHRTGSEVLIWGNASILILRKESLRKELSRKIHLTKTRLSYQVSILELLSQHQWHTTPHPSPLQVPCTLETKKPALCTQGYTAEIKAQACGSTSEETSFGAQWRATWLSPDKGHSKLTRNCSQCFSYFLIGQKYYMLWFPDFDFLEKKHSPKNVGRNNTELSFLYFTISLKRDVNILEAGKL